MNKPIGLHTIDGLNQVLNDNPDLQINEYVENRCYLMIVKVQNQFSDVFFLKIQTFNKKIRYYF